MKVVVIVPSITMVHMNFATSLAGMVAGSAMGGIDVGVLNPRGAYVQKNRFRGVKKALEFGVDYILFIDTDMSFPNNSLVQLIKAEKDIVGANYVRRAPPYDSLAKTTNGKSQFVSGIVEVDWIPTGLLLVKTDVFRALPRPWFEVKWNGIDYVGEDYSFCNLARNHGYKIWMDCDLSAQVVHWGEMGFKWTGEGQGYSFVAENPG